MRIAESVINEIKSRLSIVDVVSMYIPVQKRGRDYWVVCPFHADKNPSMKLDVQTGSYYCFGCKASGSIFTFVMKMENIPFAEAVQKLASVAGVQVYADNASATRRENEKNKIYALYKLLNDYFSEYLWSSSSESKAALDYIHNRGFKDETIKEFSLGYAPSDPLFVRNFALKNNFDEYIIARSGLFSSKGYSYFQDRITFPIFSKTGKIVAFSARTMKNDENTPKYINSAETVAFSKKSEFFGFYQSLNALKNKEIPLICEGNFDVLALHQSGVKSAVATCGTALSDEQCLLLRRYNDNVKTFFDSDDAGLKATIKSIPMIYRASLKPKIVVLNSKRAKDSAELMQKEGSEALKKIADNPISPLKYIVGYLSSKNDISTSSGKNKVLEEMTPIIESLQSNVERSEAFHRICSMIGLNEDEARSDYNTARTKKFERDSMRERYRINNPSEEKKSFWETDDDNPLYETDMIKHLAFDRELFCSSPEIRKINFGEFQNRKAAVIFSYLSEKAFLCDKKNNDIFLEGIEDEGMKNYLEKARYEAELFAKCPFEEREKSIRLAVGHMELHEKEKGIAYYKQAFACGADITLSAGLEARRELEAMEREYRELSQKLQKGEV